MHFTSTPCRTLPVGHALLGGDCRLAIHPWVAFVEPDRLVSYPTPTNGSVWWHKADPQAVWVADWALQRVPPPHAYSTVSSPTPHELGSHPAGRQSHATWRAWAFGLQLRRLVVLGAIGMGGGVTEESGGIWHTRARTHADRPPHTDIYTHLPPPLILSHVFRRWARVSGRPRGIRTVK